MRNVLWTRSRQRIALWKGAAGDAGTRRSKSITPMRVLIRRGLHSEAVAFIVNHTSPASVSDALHLMMSQGRKLDLGNPNPGNVGSDFARFGMDFWSAVKALDARNQRRQDALQDLNEWRNAIAHQDWAAAPPCASAPSGSGARRVGPWRDPSTAPSESTSRRWWEASLGDGVRLLVSSA